MLRRLFASRGFLSVSGVVLVTTAVVGGYAVATDAGRPTRAYCALMPDAIGLYPGSHVTLRGVRVGAVSALRPEGTGVRVDFRVDADHPLRGAVSAVTVSDTLVADRDLAVLTEGAGASEWDQRACVTDTLTPKSMTQTMAALEKLSGALTAGEDPAERQLLGRGLAAFDRATAGTGPSLNTLIRALGSALDSPDAAIGNIGALIDAMSELAAKLGTHWGAVEQTLTRLGETLRFVNGELLPVVVDAINRLKVILIWFNDLTRTFGGALLDGLDATVPLVRLLSANVGSLHELVDMIPPITAAFRKSADPETGLTAIDYAPPKLTVAQPEADQVCAAINALTPGGCANTGAAMADIDLTRLILGAGGAR